MRIVYMAEKVEATLIRVLSWAGTVCLSGMFMMMLIQIFMRRVLNKPLVWVEDLIVFLFIWITFVGTAILFSRKLLISIDTLVVMLPMKVRIVLEALVDILLLATLLYLYSLSVDFMGRQQLMGHNLGGALAMPSWGATLAVIVSCGVMILSSLLSLLKKIAGQGHGARGLDGRTGAD